MPDWRWMLSVTIGLAALQAVLSSSAATGRIGSALKNVGSLAEYVISPAYPLIPDRRSAGGGSSGGGGGSGGGAPIVPDPPVMIPPLPLPVL